MTNDDLDDLQETICRAFDTYSVSMSEAAALLGVVLAKICLSDATRSINFTTSFMGSFSKTIVKNAEMLGENPTT